MFKRRKLKTNWENKMDNFQARNRRAVKRYENRSLPIIGAIFLIFVLGVSLSGSIQNAPVIASQEVVEVSEEPQPIVIQSINPEVYPVKIGASDFQNEMIKYAWKISGKKIEFLYMLEAESGVVFNKQSNVVSNGYREQSFGVCQVHRPSHPDVFANPLFMTRWETQVDKCFQMWDEKPSQFHATRNKSLMARARNNIKFISG